LLRRKTDTQVIGLKTELRVNIGSETVGLLEASLLSRSGAAQNSAAIRGPESERESELR
jgi:hypothetical protein